MRIRDGLKTVSRTGELEIGRIEEINVRMVHKAWQSMGEP